MTIDSQFPSKQSKNEINLFMSGTGNKSMFDLGFSAGIEAAIAVIEARATRLKCRALDSKRTIEEIKETFK